MKKSRANHRYHLHLEPLEPRIALDDNSASVNGINARFLTTTGSIGLGILTGGGGSALGQVEQGRPNKPFHDPVAHNHVRPQHVYLRNGPSLPGADIRAHALEVAGVMIAS